MLINSKSADQGVLTAILHMMLGYDLIVRSVPTLGVGLDEISQTAPDLIALQDRLPPQGDAEVTMPLLRHCGYLGPILILMEINQRLRRYHLMQAGAADVLASDDLNSVRIAQALRHCQSYRASTAVAQQPAESVLEFETAG